MKCIRRYAFPVFTVLALTLFAAALISCGTSNPNSFRILESIVVTPATADAQNFTNGQVIFTATGSFSLPPTPSPVTFASPYTGQFVVDDLNNNVIATVIAQGTGTVTVQCVSGAAGTVNVVATALASNGTTSTVSGSAQITCP